MCEVFRSKVKRCSMASTALMNDPGAAEGSGHDGDECSAEAKEDPISSLHRLQAVAQVQVAADGGTVM